MVETVTKQRFIENKATGSLAEAQDGTIPVVLITPGQGTSAYYHESLIREYAPGAFPKGTHVYLDHLEEGEKRTAEKLLGTLIEDTVVNENGEATNRFKPLKKHREWVEEIAPIVGLSVSVMGEGRKGEVEGRQTVIAESLEPHVTNSVDLVPYAGRGGKFLESLLEDANASDPDATRTPTEPQAESTKGNHTTMELDQKSVEAIALAFKSVLAEDAAAKEAKAKADAEAAAAAAANAEKSDEEVTAERKELADALVAVESAELAESTKARLRESLIKGETVDVPAAIEAEKKFVEELSASRGLRFDEAGASAGGDGKTADPYTINGWS